MNNPPKMSNDLHAYLAPLTPFGVEAKYWHGAPLRVSCYLSDAMPPHRHITSARAIVIDHIQARVLVVQDPDTKHIIPGGRLEPGETPEDAVRREVSEETGWCLSTVLQIGVLHFAHTAPAPEGWKHPYPDFLQVVYAASTVQYEPGLKKADEYVLSSDFVSLDSARRLPLDLGQRVFLEAAYKASA